MTVLDSIQACVELRVPDELPVFALSQEFDAKYAGLTYAEYIQDAETIVRAQLIALDRFGWDWAWLHLDDTLEFEPLGVGVAAGENIVPATADYRTFDRRTLNRLQLPDPKTAARMPLLLDAIAGLRQARGDKTCITGRVAAPFSAVTLIFGMTDSFLVLNDNPKLFADALEFAEEHAIAYGLAQIQAGAHAIWLGDCNASSHLISPGQFEQWALEPCRRVTRAFKDAGAFVFLHNSEETIEGLRLQALTEPSVLSMGPGIDLRKVKKRLPKMAVMGNIDPIGLLQDGSASRVAAATHRLVRVAAKGGVILSSGECIPREAKGPNLHTMIDTAKKIWNLAHARR